MNEGLHTLPTGGLGAPGADDPAEAALRESEARYRDLFENANDVIYTLDLDGRITSINRRGEQTFGSTRAELLGHNAAEMVAPEYHDRMRAALRQKLEGEAAPTTYEVEIVRKDGSRVPLEVSSRLILRDGHPVGIQGIARDVSERRRAEQALRHSEERFRQLADNLPHGFIYQITGGPDAQPRFTYVSGRVEALCGVTPAEVIADSTVLHRLILEEDLPRVRALEVEAFTHHKPFDCQFRARCRGGPIRWLHCRSAPRLLPGGNIVWDGIAVDETERHAAEQALKEADRRKDEFLAMLAHELRNPLAPIRSSVEILRLIGLPDANLKQAGAVIERQVAHLARLVDDLLDVSRITSGKILLRKEPLDLVPLVRSAALDHRVLLEGTGLQLTLELPDQPLRIIGDPTRLAQVVGNLLQNASKFTDAGGAVHVRLQGDRRQESGVRSQESGVRSQGCGRDF
jgi:PAS domain S-box-containing protein